MIRTVKFMLGSANDSRLAALFVFLGVTNHFAFHIFLPLLPGHAETFVWPTIAFVTLFTVLSVTTCLLTRRGKAREASRLPAT